MTWLSWKAIAGFLGSIPRGVWIALIVLGLLAGYGCWAYGLGADSVRAEFEAKRAAEIQAAVAKAQHDAEATQEARARMFATLGWTLPKIEARTHDTITQIRTVYKDRPVPVGCDRPESVRRLLQTRIDQTNAAAGGL